MLRRSRAAQLAARFAGAADSAPSSPSSPPPQAPAGRPGRRSVSPTKRGAAPELAFESGWEDIIDDARPSIVKVLTLAATYDMQRPYTEPTLQGFSGTGFFFRNNLVDVATGKCAYADECRRVLGVDLVQFPDILTNAHVVNKAAKVAVQLAEFGARNFGASVACFYEDLDIAVIRLDDDARRAIAARRLGKEAAREYRAIAERPNATAAEKARADELLRGSPPLPALEFDESGGVRQGAPVLTIGHPLGVAPIMTTEGIFSGFTDRSDDGYAKMQISAATNHGNSGGPLLDAAGRVVGITSSGIPDAENTAFAIPTDQIRAALSGLRADARCYALRHPRLGGAITHATAALMKMRGAEADDVDSGLHVARVYPKSFLERLGVRAEDIIVRVDDMPIDEGGNIVMPPADASAVTALNDGTRRVPYLHYLALKHINQPLGITYYRGGAGVPGETGRAARRGASAPWTFSERMPIDRVFPTIDEAARDALVIEGITLVPVSLNLVDALLESGALKGARRAYMEQFHDPLNRVRPRVAISHIAPELRQTLGRDVLAPGMLVSRINDTDIGTLADVRRIFTGATRGAGSRYLSLRTEEQTLAVYELAAEAAGRAAATAWCMPASGTWSVGGAG